MNIRNLKIKIIEFSIKYKILFYISQFLHNYVMQFWLQIVILFHFYILWKRNIINSVKPILHFTPTNICNAKCIFCAYKKINDEKLIMNFETFKKAIDEFKNLWWKKISLTPIIWESLVDIWLFDKIKYAKDNWFHVSVISNWILLLVNDNYKKLVESWLDAFALSFWDINIENESFIYWVSENLSKQKIDWIIKFLEYNDKLKWINEIYYLQF